MGEVHRSEIGNDFPCGRAKILHRSHVLRRHGWRPHGRRLGGPGIAQGPIIIDGQYLAPVLRDPEPLFQASKPSPTNGETGVLGPLVQWEASSTAQWHDLYLGTSPDLGPDDFIGRELLPMTLY